MGPFDQAPIGSLLTWPVAWRPHGDRVDRSTRRHYAGNAMGQTRLHEACIYHRSNAIGGRSVAKETTAPSNETQTAHTTATGTHVTLLLTLETNVMIIITADSSLFHHRFAHGAYR